MRDGLFLDARGTARRRSQRPPPSLTRGGLSAPRVATATAAAPTRAGTTCAAEQAYARSIAAARSDARKGHSDELGWKEQREGASRTLAVTRVVCNGGGAKTIACPTSRPSST